MNSLGTDFALDSDHNLVVEDGDLALIEGLDCLVANLLDRLLSSPGSLLHHPDFGATLQDRVGELPHEEMLAQLAAEARLQLLADPRVLSVEECRAVPASDYYASAAPSSHNLGHQTPRGEPSAPSAEECEAMVLLLVSLTASSGESYTGLILPL
jgi:hypothetical protein